MKPVNYYTSLTTKERSQYAERSGCSIHHFHNLFRVRGGAKKIPRPELLVNLCLASEGNVSLDEAIDYFHIQPIKALAADMQSDLEPVKRLNYAKPNSDQLEMKVLNDGERVAL